MRPVPVLRRAKRPCAWGCVVLLLAGVSLGTPALALQLPLHLPDIPDVSMHLDGMVHYTLGIRTESPDAAIYRNPQYTEADLEYSKFGLNTARLDFSSSFEAQYQDWAGFRFSGAAWMDNAFSSTLK